MELEPGEFALMRAVAASDGEPQNALAERLHISPSWMVAIVDQLERRGLLERRPHARDRRVRNLHLTAAGKKLLKQAERRAEQFDRQVSDPLTERGARNSCSSLLQRVAAGLDLRARSGARRAARARLAAVDLKLRLLDAVGDEQLDRIRRARDEVVRIVVRLEVREHPVGERPRIAALRAADADPQAEEVRRAELLRDRAQPVVARRGRRPP